MRIFKFICSIALCVCWCSGSCRKYLSRFETNSQWRSRKKKRTSGMFDFENMQSKFQEERRTVRERLRAVNEIDLARLMSDACALMEDEALQLLASKLSFKGLLDLRDAIQHVPNNIPRIVNGISLRLSFIFKIFKSLLSKKKRPLEEITSSFIH